MSLNKKAWDDLTKITGIGESRQEWFRLSFDIRTFQDLAGLTVAQIEENMKRDGLIVSRKAIKAWLDQAGELAGHIGETLQTMEKPPAELPLEASNALSRENGWKPIASFVVEYQTREASKQTTEERTVAHHMEEDRTKTWYGIEDKQLCIWIIDQIPREFSRKQEKHELLHTQLPEEKQDIKFTAIKITNLRIHQPANSASPVQSIDPDTHFQASVQCVQPFSFEVNFELVGPKAKEVADSKINWIAETRTFDAASHTSPQLCEYGPNPFEKGRFKYVLSLPEISLQPGTYRVWALITPDSSSIALPDFLDIPNLRVF